MTKPHDDGDNNSLAARVRELEDARQIEALKAQYARRSDAVFGSPGPASATALADLFTDDGVLDLGPFGRYEGRASLLNAFENLLPQGTKWSTHYIVSPILDVTGNEATGHWYYLIQSVPAAPGSGLIQIFGSYADRYQRTASGWKIKETITAFFMPPT